MTWPTTPNDFSDIPHSERVTDTILVADRAAEDAVVSIVHTYRDELESITCGDETTEKALGDLLIRAAVYSTNRERRIMRGLPIG